jgi:hypothetical protein
MTKPWRCTTKDCSFDEQTHIDGAWCRGIEGVTHSEGYTEQHWPKRSQGGKEIVALLCAYCHSEVDNGFRWGNAVIEVNGSRYYRMWDLNNNTLIERELSNVTGTRDHAEEAGAVLPAMRTEREVAHIQVQGRTETGDEELDGQSDRDLLLARDSSARSGLSSSTGGRPGSNPDGSLDDWVYRGQQLREMLEVQQKGIVATAFETGDWVNEGEGRFGESASQFIDMFSYWKVNRWARLARLIPPENREFGNATNITLEHFRVVADEPPDEQRRLLQAAVDTGQSAADMKRRDDTDERETCVCTCGNEHRRKV